MAPVRSSGDPTAPAERRPYLRPGFVLGVTASLGAVGVFLLRSRPEGLPALMGAAAALFSALTLWVSRGDRRPRFVRLLVAVSSLFLGAFAAARHPPATNVPAIDAHLDDEEPLRFRGQLVEPPVRRLDPPRWKSIEPQPRQTLWMRLDTLVGSPDVPVDALVRLGTPDVPLGVRVGDRVEGLARLFSPRIPMNPGEADDAPRMRRQGIAYVGALQRGALVSIEPGGGFRAWAQGFRERFAAFCERVLGEGDRAALVAALAVGERGGIDPEANRAFNASGLAHVLSISGLHLAVAVAALAWLLRFLFGLSAWISARIAPRVLAAAVALPITAFYVVLVGAPPPAVRAGLGMGLVLGARLFGRELDGLNTLGWCLAAVALVDPVSLLDVSTQLSFFGVLGLVVIAPALRAMLPWKPPETPIRWKKWAFTLGDAVLNLVLASLAATIATSHLTALYFERASLVSALANVVAWPASTVIVPAGAVAAAVFPLSETLALPFLHLAGACAWFLSWCATWFASWPAASISVPPPSPFAMVAWGVFIALVLNARRWSLVTSTIVVSIAVVFVAITARMPAPLEPGRLEVTFLSVGQGDAAVIRFPHGSVMVVDAGGEVNMRSDPGARVVAPFLRHVGATKVDHVVASHPHPDHIAGLPAVFERFRVGSLWHDGDFGLDADAWEQGGEDPTTVPPPLGKLVDLARESGAQVREFIQELPTACPGLPPLKETFPEVDALAIGDPRCAPPVPFVEIDGVRVEVLHPLGGPQHSAYPELGENDNSLVLRLVHGDVAILLPGDIEREGEAVLRARGVDLRADLVKAPHHGSRTSSTPEFVEATGAKEVVFCVGKDNQFGFPKSEVVERWRAAGARAWRTDRNGAVTATSDGKRLEMRAFVSRPQ